ncbi:MAG: hypothetical protein LBI05_12060, partial [Planctomycetaceae bacterium]|nr:hypothetical protein [Planctomycetaceae bacterium]
MKCKFPVNITWDELNNKGVHCPDVSCELLSTTDKEFFIFGASGLWGKYAAIDYWDRSIKESDTPLDIIGFKSELASIFKQHFDYDERMLFYETGLSEEELAEDRERLPKWV